MMIKGKFLLFSLFYLFGCTNSKTVVWLLKSVCTKKKFAFTFQKIQLTENGPTLLYELKRFEHNGETETNVYEENEKGTLTLLKNYQFPQRIKLERLERINENYASKKHTAQ